MDDYCDEDKRAALDIDFVDCLAISNYKVIVLPCEEVHPYIALFGSYLSFLFLSLC